MATELEIVLESQEEDVREATKFTVIGKIISKKPLNRRGVIGVLQSIWPRKEILTIREMGQNLYAISFVNQQFMEDALANGPWSVMGCYLNIKKWEIGQAMSDLDFSRVDFWLQVHNLPLEMLTCQNAEKIGVVIVRNCEQYEGGQLRYGPHMRTGPIWDKKVVRWPGGDKGKQCMDSTLNKDCLMLDKEGEGILKWESRSMGESSGANKRVYQECSFISPVKCGDGVIMVEDGIDKLQKVDTDATAHKVDEVDIVGVEESQVQHDNEGGKDVEVADFRKLNLKRGCQDWEELVLPIGKRCKLEIGENKENNYKIDSAKVDSELSLRDVKGRQRKKYQSRSAVKNKGVRRRCRVERSLRGGVLQEVEVHEIEYWDANKVNEQLESFLEGSCYVDPVGIGGGLALWWDQYWVVTVIGKCKNLIDVEVAGGDLERSIRIFWIYGPPTFEERQDVWRMIIDRSRSFDAPWICIGDFNDFLYIHEKEGGNVRAARKMAGFWNFVNQCQLIDVHCHGQRFTWMCKRDGNLIKERIDRVMVNVSWMDLFPNTQAFNLPIIGSDHGPILVDSNLEDSKAPKQFKFEIMWMDKEDCAQVIQDGWNADFQGSYAYQLVAEIQDKDSDSHSLAKAEILIVRLHETWKQEEKYWSQRSRINWLRHGDQNSKFFHQSTIIQRQRNKILSLKVENEDWIENEDEILEVFTQYYEKLFTTEGDRDWHNELEYVPQLVTAAMNEEITKEVTEEEIMEAAFQMGALKAPGPDGYNGAFYQGYWEIIKTAVVNMVKSFFHCGVMLKEVNRTRVALVPKGLKPELVTQFRPISCCNYVYKIISKVIANRLKPMMNDFGSEERRKNHGRQRSSGASSSYLIPEDLWKFIWNLNVPNRIRIFMWRACKSILINHVLWRRHLRQDPVCPCCSKFPETIEHTLLLCDWVLPVWFGVIGIRVNRDQIRTLDEWLMTVLRDSGQGKEYQIHLGTAIVVTCWFIWKARCQHVFEKAELRPDIIVPIIQRFILELEDANSLTRSKKATTEVRIKEDKWKAPEEGWSKLNCDGAIDTKTFDAGIGVIVRNSTADLIGGKGLSLQVSSIEEAEAVAIR
ncbi:reverse transcriptase [Corchorus capsularis]|uniref:Reverse transcriptase n=1 Tax=Corchorus capsularis TaxID=210143 RepID=A0A1R3GN70_COCAP|nr:reverse transcriptase [Corchorus capsularis]